MYDCSGCKGDLILWVELQRRDYGLDRFRIAPQKHKSECSVTVKASVIWFESYRLVSKVECF